MKRPSISRRKIITVMVPVAILAFALIIQKILIETKPQAKTKVVNERVWSVQAQTVRKSRLQPDLQLYGRVESPTLATLTSAIEADVTSVFVQAGDTVSAGDPLIKLDGREAEQRLLQRQAELAEIDALIDAEQKRYSHDKKALGYEKKLLMLANKALQRAQNLEKNNMASQTQADETMQNKVRQQLAVASREHAIAEYPARLAQLKARREQSATRLSLARLDLDRAQVKAEFDARVSAIHVAPGQRVRRGEKLLSIYDPGKLEVRAQIPVQQMSVLRRAFQSKEAMTATSELDGVSIELQMKRFASAVERGRGGVDGYFQVKKGSAVLQVGRVLDLYLRMPPVDDTVALPRDALYGTDRIYKIEAGKLKPVTVNLVGEKRQDAGGQLLVQSKQLREGDRVLVTKFANAMEGLPVKVTP